VPAQHAYRSVRRFAEEWLDDVQYDDLDCRAVYCTLVVQDIVIVGQR
jgi:hypothetical protein